MVSEVIDPHYFWPGVRQNIKATGLMTAQKRAGRDWRRKGEQRKGGVGREERHPSKAPLTTSHQLGPAS